MGEDHLVRIYTKEGRSSGLSFFAQIKSTSNLKQLPSVGDAVSYPIPVKDLLYWEDNVPAVFLVLWDVTQQMGLWLPVRDVVKRLDTYKPEWRSRTGRRAAVAVHFPTTNEIDRRGLAEIRHHLAMDALPIVSKGKDFTIGVRLVFPPTEEGRAKMSEWEEHVEAGAPASIPQEYVEAVEFPEWWNRLFDREPGPAAIAVGPASSGRKVPISISAISLAGTAVQIPYLECDVVQGGRRKATLSNVGQRAAAYVTLVLDRKEGRCTVTVKPGWGPALTVEDHVRAARLFRCISEGCDFTLTMLKQGDGSCQISRVAAQPQHAPPKDWYELLEDLQAIEKQFKVSFQLRAEGVSQRDAAIARRIATIMACGYLPLKEATNGSFTVDREAAERWLGEWQFPFRYEFTRPWPSKEEPLDVLGVAIDLGASQMRVRNILEKEQLTGYLAGASDKGVEVSIAGAELRREWPQFLPPSDPAEATLLLKGTPR